MLEGVTVAPKPPFGSFPASRCPEGARAATLEDMASEDMASHFDSVALEALALDASERLRLAVELINSVEGPESEDWNDAWLKELEARRHSGMSDAKPWREVRERVLRRFSPK